MEMESEVKQENLSFLFYFWHIFTIEIKDNDIKFKQKISISLNCKNMHALKRHILQKLRLEILHQFYLTTYAV